MIPTRLSGVLSAAILLASVAAPSARQAQEPVSQFAAPPDVAAPPADAVKSPSGLASKVLTPGRSSEKPAPTDIVTVQYTGWSANGALVDTSLERERPAMFPLDRAALAGWRECVQLMVVGEKRRCWMPEKLAYAGAKNRPAGMMVFDIELLDTRPTPAVAPPDVSGPPRDANRTSTGLAYKVLRPGTGTERPDAGDSVTVHYSGWMTNGKLFDSSVTRGAPTTLSLNDVIPGWREGLQLMTVGERTRFWIPQNLAYRGEPGSPRGMLVFDVDLLAIE